MNEHREQKQGEPTELFFQFDPDDVTIFIDHWIETRATELNCPICGGSHSPDDAGSKEGDTYKYRCPETGKPLAHRTESKAVDFSGKIRELHRWIYYLDTE